MYFLNNINSIVSLIYDNWLSIIFFVIILILYYLYRNSSKLDRFLPSFSAGGTPILDNFSRDMTKMAKDGTLDPVIGREEEVQRLIQILSRRTKNNVVLVGKPGIGKTAIAEGLAEMIVNKKVPELLYGKRVLALDLNSIVSGTKYRGEFEERIKSIANEIIQNKRNIILFIDEIHILAETGAAAGALSAADILKPALARGDLQVVGATTPAEYEQYIKKDPTLDRRLISIEISEPTENQTFQILMGIKDAYEKHHGVKISEEAIKSSIEFSRVLHERSFPDKAIDLMDEAASKVKLKIVRSGAGEQKPESAIVIAKDVEEVARQFYNIKL